MKKFFQKRIQQEEQKQDKGFRRRQSSLDNIAQLNPDNLKNQDEQSKEVKQRSMKLIQEPGMEKSDQKSQKSQQEGENQHKIIKVDFLSEAIVETERRYNQAMRILKKKVRDNDEAAILYQYFQSHSYLKKFLDNKEQENQDNSRAIHLCKHMQLEEFKANQIIMKQNDPSNDKLYVILEGSVSIISMSNTKFEDQKLIKKQALLIKKKLNKALNMDFKLKKAENNKQNNDNSNNTLNVGGQNTRFEGLMSSKQFLKTNDQNRKTQLVGNLGSSLIKRSGMNLSQQPNNENNNNNNNNSLLKTPNSKKGTKQKLSFNFNELNIPNKQSVMLTSPIKNIQQKNSVKNSIQLSISKSSISESNFNNSNQSGSNNNFQIKINNENLDVNNNNNSDKKQQKIKKKSSDQIKLQDSNQDNLEEIKEIEDNKSVVKQNENEEKKKKENDKDFDSEENEEDYLEDIDSDIDDDEEENLILHNEYNLPPEDLHKIVCSKYGEILATLKQNMGFGEAALTQQGPSKRNATIIAQKHTKCLIIMKKDFNYVTEYFSREMRDKKKFVLNQLPFLETITSQMIFDRLFKSFEEIEFQKYKVLYEEDESGDVVYVLKKGQCILQKRVQDFSTNVVEKTKKIKISEITGPTIIGEEILFENVNDFSDNVNSMDNNGYQYDFKGHYMCTLTVSSYAATFYKLPLHALVKLFPSLSGFKNDTFFLHKSRIIQIREKMEQYYQKIDDQEIDHINVLNFEKSKDIFHQMQDRIVDQKNKMQKYIVQKEIEVKQNQRGNQVQQLEFVKNGKQKIIEEYQQSKTEKKLIKGQVKKFQTQQKLPQNLYSELNKIKCENKSIKMSDLHKKFPELNIFSDESNRSKYQDIKSQYYKKKWNNSEFSAEKDRNIDETICKLKQQQQQQYQQNSNLTKNNININNTNITQENNLNNQNTSNNNNQLDIAQFQNNMNINRKSQQYLKQKKEEIICQKSNENAIFGNTFNQDQIDIQNIKTLDFGGPNNETALEKHFQKTIGTLQEQLKNGGISSSLPKQSHSKGNRQLMNGNVYSNKIKERVSIFKGQSMLGLKTFNSFGSEDNQSSQSQNEIQELSLEDKSLIEIQQSIPQINNNKKNSSSINSNSNNNNQSRIPQFNNIQRKLTHKSSQDISETTPQNNKHNQSQQKLTKLNLNSQNTQTINTQNSQSNSNLNSKQFSKKNSKKINLLQYNGYNSGIDTFSMTPSNSTPNIMNSLFQKGIEGVDITNTPSNRYKSFLIKNIKDKSLMSQNTPQSKGYINSCSDLKSDYNFKQFYKNSQNLKSTLDFRKYESEQETPNIQNSNKNQQQIDKVPQTSPIKGNYQQINSQNNTASNFSQYIKLVHNDSSKNSKNKQINLNSKTVYNTNSSYNNLSLNNDYSPVKQYKKNFNSKEYYTIQNNNNSNSKSKFNSQRKQIKRNLSEFSQNNNNSIHGFKKEFTQTSDFSTSFNQLSLNQDKQQYYSENSNQNQKQMNTLQYLDDNYELLQTQAKSQQNFNQKTAKINNIKNTNKRAIYYLPTKSNSSLNFQDENNKILNKSENQYDFNKRLQYLKKQKSQLSNTQKINLRSNNKPQNSIQNAQEYQLLTQLPKNITQNE